MPRLPAPAPAVEAITFSIELCGPPSLGLLLPVAGLAQHAAAGSR